MVIKPKMIEVAIERTERAGPAVIGFSDIKVVENALADGSSAHAVSVVITTLVAGGPGSAREFQNCIAGMIREAANAGRAAARVLDADGKEVASSSREESPSPPGQE